MIRKRAHSLRYTKVTPGVAVQDSNGDWIPSQPIEQEVVLNCRADVNSSGRTVKNNDGQDYVYSFAVFLSSIPESLIRGTMVEVIENGKIKGRGEVIFPWEYQSTNKLWV